MRVHGGGFRISGFGLSVQGSKAEMDDLEVFHIHANDHHTQHLFVQKKVVHLKLSGKAHSSILLVKIMMCSKLHCTTIFILNPFSLRFRVWVLGLRGLGASC